MSAIAPEFFVVRCNAVLSELMQNITKVTVFNLAPELLSVDLEQP